MEVAKTGMEEETKGTKVETKVANLCLYPSSLFHNHSQTKGETRAGEIKVVTEETVEARAVMGGIREIREGIKVVTGEEIKGTKAGTKDSSLRHYLSSLRLNLSQIKRETRAEEIKETKAGTKENSPCQYPSFLHRSLSQMKGEIKAGETKVMVEETRAIKAGTKEEEIKGVVGGTAEARAVTSEAIRATRAETKESNLRLSLSSLRHSRSQSSHRRLLTKGVTKVVAGEGIRAEAKMVTWEEIRAIKVGVKEVTKETKVIRGTKEGIKGIKGGIKEVEISNLHRKAILAALV